MDTKKIEDAATATIEGAQKVAVVVELVIKQWAKELLDWAKQGKDIVAEQVPLLVQEIIKWGFAEAILYMVLAVAIFLSSRYLMKKWYEKPVTSCWRDWDEGGPLPGFAWVVIGGGHVFSFYLFFNNLFVAVKTLVAPRVYLIEYLANLVQNTPK